MNDSPPAMPAVSPSSAPHPLVAGLTALTDTQLVLLIAAVLFALAAWPLLLVPLPPFQDLPNHVATAHIVAHPDLYPQFVFNGLVKSNCLLTLWFCLVGGHGLFGAARAFTAIVLAANALALPLFVLHFSGRRALVVAMLFLWPLVHSFTVSMGFLNFTFAFALSLILLIVLDRQRERPTLGRGLGIVAISTAVWYAHPFPLAVVGALVALHAATRAGRRERMAAAVALLLPLVPAGLLVLVTAQHHLVKAEHSSAAAATFRFLNPWEILSHLWMDASGALTRWGSMTIVPALLLPYFAWAQRRAPRPFLSTAAVAVLIVSYFGLPDMMSNWNYLNSRLVPFLWVGLALRLPTTLPRPVAILLTICALSFSAVQGIDYVRLDRDRVEFTAGIEAVPEGATLLPLLFNHSKTSYFTASLSHAWGYYTVAKDTAAPLVFGVERSYPITYRDFPPRKLIPPAIDQFAVRYGTPSKVCKALNQAPVDAACTAAWRELWAGFWQEATPRFSYLLIWAIPPEARSMIPEVYHRVFVAGELEIYAR